MNDFPPSPQAVSEPDARNGPAPPDVPNAVPGDTAPAEERPAASRRKRGLGPGALFLIKLGLAAAFFAALFIFVLGVHIQQGNRMHPYIMDGDLVVTYKLDRIRVGDVVAYRHPDTGKTAVSRVAAVGPALVDVTAQGELLVNGTVPEERVFYPTKPLPNGPVTYPFALAEGEFFLLDDFRTEGQDSRIFGRLTKDDLLGKAVYILRRRGI